MLMQMDNILLNLVIDDTIIRWSGSCASGVVSKESTMNGIVANNFERLLMEVLKVREKHLSKLFLLISTHHQQQHLVYIREPLAIRTHCE